MSEHVFTFHFDCIISEQNKEIPYSPWEVTVTRTEESEKGVRKIWLNTKDGLKGTAQAKSEEEEVQLQTFVRNSKARPMKK